MLLVAEKNYLSHGVKIFPCYKQKSTVFQFWNWSLPQFWTILNFLQKGMFLILLANIWKIWTKSAGSSLNHRTYLNERNTLSLSRSFASGKISLNQIFYIILCIYFTFPYTCQISKKWAKEISLDWKKTTNKIFTRKRTKEQTKLTQ